MAADPMPASASRWGETWRVLAYTVAVTLAFIALGRIELALFGAAPTRRLLERGGLIGARDDAQWIREGAEIAAASRDALARLPAGHRVAALRIGYEVGYASYLLGSYTGSSEAARATARRVAATRLALARALGATFGVTAVDALAVENLKQFTELNTRLDADESGLAAQVEQKMSPLHRELTLLGEQLGTEAARIEGSGGRMSLPPATLIRRHAVLAGVAPALWEPLTLEPQPDEAPAQVVARYRAALNALGAALN